MLKMTLRDGAELVYDVAGSGPLLVLVSGLGGLGSFWRPVVERLAPYRRVLTYDHRGTGASTWSDPPYSVDQMTDDLLQLLDHVAPGPVDVVGHSTGGAIGQTLAAALPQRIRKLVLSGTWTAADDYFRHLFETRRRILRASGPAEYVRASALFLWSHDYVRDHLSEIERQAKDAVKGPSSGILESRIDAILRFDRRAQLGSIKVPTLCIAARDDRVIPPYFNEDLAQRIPTAETAVLPDGGHLFPATRPAEFVRIVGGFLDIAVV